MEKTVLFLRSTVSKILDRREKYRTVAESAKLGRGLGVVWPEEAASTDD
ncbi:hypothetical protein [Natrinema sp. 1APR25-10V2]|nr:hypothetical protein [Natrinema sp. 1APR25-10V2]MDS0473512.1 hypothetical protein [Natrinema sp. 1APR25-10V2]